MLNPVHLRTLVTVVSTGSFADAGRVLGYSGSAVSQQISALERQLRTTLFERDAHSVRPTPAAVFVAGHSAAALHTLEALERDVAAFLGGAIGTLRLGSFPSASERLLPAALSTFVRRNPQVGIQLDEGEPAELVPVLRARELDLALVYRYDLVPMSWPEDLLVSPVLVEELLLLLPPRHRGAGSDELGLAELREETWICTRESTAMAVTLRRLCAAHGFEPQVSYRSNDYDVIHGLVRSGLGIALVPALGLPLEPSVPVARLAGAPASRRVAVLRAPAARGAAVDEAVEALCSAARDLARRGNGISVPS